MPCSCGAGVIDMAVAPDGYKRLLRVDSEISKEATSSAKIFCKSALLNVVQHETTPSVIRASVMGQATERPSSSDFEDLRL